MANYTKIKNFDIANGQGLRVSIFFSGCELKCKGCFNHELWDFNHGKLFTKEIYENEIKPIVNEHIRGISVLGGEPLHPRNIESVAHLITWFKSDFPNKDIWVWSGFIWKTLMEQINHEWTDKTNRDYSYWLEIVLDHIDVLIDGEFIEEQRDLTLKWRGSSNQCVIDVQKSLKENNVVLYE